MADESSLPPLMGGDEENVVRVRGLPWSATVEEIESFFGECTLKNGADSIHMTMTREGRPSGEAYIEMQSEADVDKALQKDRQHMGKRYVEVFKTKKSEMEWVIKRANAQPGFEGGDSMQAGGDNVVRLRGLPFECTRDDILNFFAGLEIPPNGVLLTTNYQGRATGEAFVQFVDRDGAERALEKNKQTIGHRYIEIFRSSMAEAKRYQMNMGYGGAPRDIGGARGGRGGASFGGAAPGGYGVPPMRGAGRPGPYDRLQAPLGRGYGAYGPTTRGSRNYKSFGSGAAGAQPRGGYGEENYYEDGNYGGGYGGVAAGGYGTGMERRHIVHMRGLPFRVTEADIAEWFSSVVDPVDIKINYNDQGRPAGEADVLFSCEADARKAMAKDRQNMQHRYIELFYDGSAVAPRGGGGGGYNGGAGFANDMSLNSGFGGF